MFTERRGGERVNMDAVLCLVKDDWAWFTTQPLEAQWGDDWDDGPAAYNAEAPYEYDVERDAAPYDIVMVAWWGPYTTPMVGSALDINRQRRPWLIPYRGKPCRPIPAGTTLADFIAAMREAGGKVYVEVSE